MSLKCIVRLVLVFLSFANIAVAQYKQEKAFLKHLTKEGLLDEKLYLLRTLSDSNLAPVCIEKAWTLSKLGNGSEALRYYHSVSFDSVLEIGFSRHYFRLLFISDSLVRINKLLESHHSKIDSQSVSKMELSLRLLRAEVPINTPLPEYLSNTYTTHLFYQKKSLALATAFSVLLPGMGKLYLRKPRQGLNMLLANLIFGIQAFESYAKAGPESLRFIAFGSLFAAFYSGNIYGTIKGFKKSRKDSYKQLQHEIDTYHLADFGYYPY